jgi:hypothetical protein
MCRAGGGIFKVLTAARMFMYSTERNVIPDAQATAMFWVTVRSTERLVLEFLRRYE